MTRLLPTILLLSGFTAATLVQREEAKYPDYGLLKTCPGYKASNVKTTSSGLTADLTITGECNAYGEDLDNLVLQVTYESGEFVTLCPIPAQEVADDRWSFLDSRLHVKIQDADLQVYQVPEEVVPRPASQLVGAGDSL